MIPQDPYFEGIIHSKRHRVNGLVLRPFCWAHYEYLRAIGNPAYLGQIADPPQLAQAVAVCSSPNPLAVGPRFGLLPRLLAVLHGPCFAREAAKFAAYIQDYCSLPETAESLTIKAGKKPKQGKPSITPMALRIICRLIELGIPEERAWTMPLAYSIWLGYASAENNGAKLTLLTEWELKTLTSDDDDEGEE